MVRKGAADLEKSVDGIKNYFFKDGVQMVVDGYSLDEITEIMETRIEYREKRENVQKSMLKSMGGPCSSVGYGRYSYWSCSYVSWFWR